MTRSVSLAPHTRHDLDDAALGLSGDPLDQIRAEFLIRATLARRSTILPGDVVSITRVAAPADDEAAEIRIDTVDREFERRITRQRFDA
ncbi:hypothetical protein FV218_12275 [Methylobacterium sp. WL69]|uniref:hypothetical protein n=1 Tax=Methylobacterium sp. WL69 TaxID=2603893 RepID=UPI0011C7AD91|nr:hypothetical protein [Methylobacterium sp. WL69]TXM72908.1 hypothetical protein FV218_12275 [Methylobacterium sp. WL69]